MKARFIIPLLLLGAPVSAQRIYLDSARIYLSQDNYKRALPFADAAIKNEKTKADPEAWFLRGMVYLQMAQDATANKPNSVVDAYGSFLKTLTIKPDYGMEINNPLHSVAIIKFNNAAKLFSAKSFDRAYNEFAEVYAIYKMGGGQRFLDNSEFKGMAYDARKNAASAASNAGRNEDAISLLEDMLKGDYKGDADVYQSLINIYDAEKNNAGEIAIINAARAQFPKNESFRIVELNYYINNGKVEELVPKLEDAVNKDPGNADLLFRLANAYTAESFPADERGKLFAQPANFAQLFTKAEQAYSKALQLAPADAAHNFNFGMLYYNYSRWYSTQMAASPNADDKLITEFTAKRNEEYGKALPYFEKSFSLLDPKVGALADLEKGIYHNTMIVLKQIYSQNGNTAKQTQMEQALAKWK